MSLPCRDATAGAHLVVRVQPRASRTGLAGLHGVAVKVLLTTPPVDGRANVACVALFAKLVGVPRSAIEVQRGAASRDKVLLFHGVTCAELVARLAPHLFSGGVG
jgi:uncharacterized protein (TIGR00251 family)